jgi:4-amino-4-deoxy-L-arabinose transferase-like glycosyltransferase
MKAAALALLFVLLVAVRLPSLVQPAGGDQGLYAYVGDRILQGEIPYLDAWDQKPPGLHFAYALMFGAWHDDRVVALTDLVLAVLTALALGCLGRRLLPGTGAGWVAAALFLLLSNPALGRLGGVRTRAQAEVFIGLAVAVALCLLARTLAHRRGDRVRGVWALVAGALLGTAFLFKYNAGAYLAPALLAVWLWSPVARDGAQRRQAVLLVAGFVLPVAACVLYFAMHGALGDLYHATLTYNMRYSGETYSGPGELLVYLATFPIRHARLDSLWWMGGLGAVVLLLGSLSRPTLLVVPAWVAAACLSIAVNGSRGLPQYFVQASPALSLAAAALIVLAWQRLGAASRAALIVLLAIGVWRVSNFDKVADYTAWDLRHATGGLSREAYLARFGERASGDKYSALAVHELAGYLRAHTGPNERVLVFGFSPGALVQARRESASRFFWSRPVIVGFREGEPGYGPTGLAVELDMNRPALVVLQRHDWDPDGPDSASFFWSQPLLAAWLRTHYEPADELGNFEIWRQLATQVVREQP